MRLTTTNVATLYDPDDRKFTMWYTQSLSGDPDGTGQVVCYAESADALTWQRPIVDEFRNWAIQVA